jgi:hypothetical protein
MQFKKTILRLLLILFPAASIAQTTYLPQGDKANILLERMEIKLKGDSLNFSKTKPFSRKALVSTVEAWSDNTPVIIKGMNGVDSQVTRAQAFRLSKVDVYNMRSFLMNNSEWTTQKFPSKKPIWKNFYKTPANLYEVHVKDFDLILNPVFQYVISKESNNDQDLFLNTRGLTVRGRIANKIGFAAYMTDNQERDPAYVQQWISDRKAVPGEGLYKTFKAAGGVDYFDARGHFTFNVTKYIDVAFGYDKNFIGNGHRSLFLSDFGTNNLFLKLNTRIWKMNYQNLFMELHSAFIPGGDKLIGKKYAALHHLDVAITKWLNIGLF